MPDLQTRISHLKTLLEKYPNKFTEKDFINLGQSCEGYSCYDLAVLVKEATAMPIRHCQAATRFRKTPDGKFEPTYPTDPQGIEMKLN